MWGTCEIFTALRRGEGTERLPTITASFPPQFGADERFWAAGEFTLYDYRALGDGSWHTSTPVMAGTGSIGRGLLVGSVFGGMIARRRAKKAARAAAVPRWVPIEQGWVFVSAYGFYLHTPAGVVLGLAVSHRCDSGRARSAVRLREQPTWVGFLAAVLGLG